MMLGLNGVGKTTALYKLRSGRAKLDTEPTMGLNVETIEFKSVSFALWDIGGNDRMPNMKKNPFSTSLAVITVIIATNMYYDDNWQVILSYLKAESRIRHIWKHHGLNSAETDAMIYVIDSADVVRMDLARAELAAQVGESGLGSCWGGGLRCHFMKSKLSLYNPCCDAQIPE